MVSEQGAFVGAGLKKPPPSVTHLLIQHGGTNSPFLLFTSISEHTEREG